MAYTIAEIAEAASLEAEGDLSLTVERPAEPAVAGVSDLALAMSKDYAEALQASAARAAVVWPGADWRALGLDAVLMAPRARVALAGVNQLFAPPPDLAPGVHPSAIVDPAAKLGDDVWVGPFAVINAEAEIGDGARIYSHVSIGRGAQIGPGAVLHAGVRIGALVVIGRGFIAQANAVIGADGFSYVTPERGSVESAKETGAVADDARNVHLRRIASLGTVEIGDDVEVGACATVDRGTLAATRIGSGTKIDNQVMIGHNCIVGANCLICGQVGIAGSCEIGDRVVLGGQVGIGDHLTIGSDTLLAGGSLVGANIPSGKVMMGAPAAPREQVYAQVMAMRRLPRVIEQVQEIRKKLGL